MSEKKKEVQQYLAEHVNTFIEPMVYDMVKKRPADPVAFSVQWLTEHIGTFSIIQQNEKRLDMIHNQMMTVRKCPLITRNFKRKNCKERPAAEWVFPKKFLAVLTKKKASK